MDSNAVWQRYARIWSADGATRLRELDECLDAACTYCDVNGLLEGREALSRYMGAFQTQVRGGWFRIESVISHHDRMLAEWSLLGPDDVVLQTGRSFATVDADGCLKSITGFFDAKPRPAAGSLAVADGANANGLAKVRDGLT